MNIYRKPTRSNR